MQKMTNMRTLLGGLLISLLIGCVYDKFSVVEIRNNSGHDIRLTIAFNKETFEAAWGEKSYLPFIRTFGQGNGVDILNLDTVNLVGEYKIAKDSLFQMGLMEEVPDFEEYKKITVSTDNHTLVLKSTSEMKENFKVDSTGVLTWDVR
jgi:hypothetical protein